MVWLFASAGVLLLIGGWLLPWYVEGTASGVGFSPQDAIVSFSGPGTVLVYTAGLAMLSLIAGVVVDTFATVAHRGPAFRGARIRSAIALAGALATLLIVADVSVAGDRIFGRLDRYAFVDNAVWMTLTGFLLCAVAYGLRPLIMRHGGLAFALVAFALGLAFPLIFLRATDFIQWGTQFAAVYMLLALGLNVVVGFAGLLDLGYAAFFAIGAYTTASLSSGKYGVHLPFWVLIFLGASIAALFGVLLGAPTLRLRGDYLAIVTLGFGEIIPDIAFNNPNGTTGGPNGLSADPASIFGVNLHYLGQVPENSRYYFWIIMLLIFAVIMALRNLERSRLGRAWIAIREDEVAASATGVNPVSTKLLAFAIGASVSGFAGAFFGAMLGTVSPENFQFAVSVTVLSTVVLGGIGNIAGVCVGAVVIAFVINWVLPKAHEWSQTVGATTGFTALNDVPFSRYSYAVYGLTLVLMMLLRPAGLLPSRARKIELTTGGGTEPDAAVAPG
jgi:branched-chain amino acid transport system permease protein